MEATTPPAIARSMAFFELNVSGSDGSARALAKAIMVASRISRDALLEFTPEKVKLCAHSHQDHDLVKFVFSKDFFAGYQFDERHKCYVSLKALSMPFKSNVLNVDKDAGPRSYIKMKCFVEDRELNQIRFIIGGSPPAATLTYKITINDVDADSKDRLNRCNRSYSNPIVTLAPGRSKRERFLLSAFNNFAPDIDQVSITSSKDAIRFIGSTSELISNLKTTSEFCHKKSEFDKFDVREDVSITIRLRPLKLFLSFVENNKVKLSSKYIFEGLAKPAHFIYECDLYRGYFVTSSSADYVPEELDDELLPIEHGNLQDESFIDDENIIPGPDVDYDYLNNDESYANLQQYDIDEIDDSNNGYNNNKSDDEDELNDFELLDVNEDGLNTTIGGGARSVNLNGSLYGGAESIRGAMTGREFDPEKVREMLNLEEDPYVNENITISYSSDDDE